MVWFVASASQQFPTIAAFSTKSNTNANTNNKKHHPQPTNNVLDPIAKLMTDTMTAVLAQLEQHNQDTTGGGGDGTKRRRRITIRIENEISGNTFHETNSKGFIFAPVLTVDNDMHGSMHNNNNAHSDSGSGK